MEKYVSRLLDEAEESEARGEKGCTMEEFFAEWDREYDELMLKREAKMHERRVS
jgi:hypothetical protein